MSKHKSWAHLKHEILAPLLHLARTSAVVTANQQFPAIRGHHISYQTSGPDTSGMGRGLEFYGPHESHSFAPGRPAVQTFGKTPPLGIVGDVVSHYLARGVDPTLTHYYKRFVNSLTPAEMNDLRVMYSRSASEGEQRPYAAWLHQVGLPAYFRGYAFKQLWANETHYTQQQRRMFDRMMVYLRTHHNK